MLETTHLGSLSGTLLKDLLDDIVIDVSTKLVLKLSLGGSIEVSLSSLAIEMWGGGGNAHKARQIEEKSGDYLSLPVSNEDLERGDEVSEGDALVSLPLLVGLNIIDEDDEVVAALVVDLGLLSLAASHCGCVLVRKEICVGGEESLNGESRQDGNRGGID
ncbi:hypothetical protein HG530_012787 [Fusarium avenaceum]|nr:hypothetical protein HG530_012787 [Fusarium avenaceum]